MRGSFGKRAHNKKIMECIRGHPIIYDQIGKVLILPARKNTWKKCCPHFPHPVSSQRGFNTIR